MSRGRAAGLRAGEIPKGARLFLLWVLASAVTGARVFSSDYRVEINTSSFQGTAGVLAIDFTSDGVDDNTVYILDFSTDGTTGLTETEGGTVSGDIFLGLNPAPSTDFREGFFLNRLEVAFLSFGTHVSFILLLTDNPPAGDHPDQVSVFLLNSGRGPLFPTSDPFGTGALFAVSIDGSVSGVLEVFAAADKLTVSYPAGLDEDGDGVSDLSDCDPTDPGVFRYPREVMGLDLAPDKVTLVWESAAPGAGADTLHDLLRGALGQSVEFSGPCLATGIAGATATDPMLPAAGQGFWYLVRATNACGVGTWGKASDDTERFSLFCF